MFRSLNAAFAALFVLLSAGAVSAQTVGTATGGGSSVIADGQQFVGQRIVAPSAGLQLQSFTLPLSRTTATFSVLPRVYEVTAGGPTSIGALTVSTVWTGAATSVTNTGVAQDYTFTPGITLDPAKVYMIAGVQATPGESGSFYFAAADTYVPGNFAYQDGGGIVRGGGLDMGFSATFAPAPVMVPTLSEWAMIGFGLLLAGGAVLMIQRRRFV